MAVGTGRMATADGVAAGGFPSHISAVYPRSRPAARRIATDLLAVVHRLDWLRWAKILHHRHCCHLRAAPTNAAADLLADAGAALALGTDPERRPRPVT